MFSIFLPLSGASTKPHCHRRPMQSSIKSGANNYYCLDNPEAFTLAKISVTICTPLFSEDILCSQRLSSFFVGNFDSTFFHAFTESAEELVGVVVGFISAEHACEDFASVLTSVVLTSFDFASFMIHLCLWNMLSNCSFCALSARSSLSRALFSLFSSSLS